MLSIEDRFLVNAALERLLADGDTFDPVDARTVIEKVPLSKGGRTELNFTFKDETPGKGAEGYAPGIGNVRGDDGKPRVKEIGYGIERTRVGGYKIAHRPGIIVVSLMWAETNLDENGSPKDGAEAVIRYDRRTGSPTLIKLSKAWTFVLVVWPRPRFEYVFNFQTYRPWKRPAVA